MSGTEHEGPSVIEQLAAYVTREAFDRLPAATVVAARRAILDTLGVTLAGAVEPTAERVRTMIVMPKVRMFVHPEQTTRECLPTRFTDVTIALKDGRVLQRRVSQAKGQPKNPLTDAQLEAKFRDCAARVLPAARIDPLVTMVKALERVPAVSALARALATT